MSKFFKNIHAFLFSYRYKDVIHMLQRVTSHGSGLGSFYALSSCSYVNPSAIVCNVKDFCCICVTFHVARIPFGIARRAPGTGLKISPGIYSTVVNSRVVPDVRTYVHNRVLSLHDALDLSIRCCSGFDAEIYARHVRVHASPVDSNALVCHSQAFNPFHSRRTQQNFSWERDA